MFTTIARASTPDSTLIFFTTLSLFLFVRLGNLTSDSASGWRELLPKSSLAFLAIYSVMAMAVLAKGPVGVLLPCVVIGCFLYVSAVSKLSPSEPDGFRTGFAVVGIQATHKTLVSAGGIFADRLGDAAVLDSCLRRGDCLALVRGRGTPNRWGLARRLFGATQRRPIFKTNGRP